MSAKASKSRLKAVQKGKHRKKGLQEQDKKVVDKNILLTLQKHINFIVSKIKKEDKIHKYTFYLIVLIAIVIRIYFMFQPIRYDEAFTFLVFASKPLFQAITSYISRNNHIFQTLLIHIAYVSLGDKPWVFRLPAFFAGIMLVPAVYIASRILYNKYSALLASGIIAASPVLVFYSSLARGYTLLCLFFMLTIIIGSYLIHAKNPTLSIMFSVFSALGFYTVPTMLYPFGLVAAWIFLSIVFQDKDVDRKALLINFFISLINTVILTSILYFPVLLSTGWKIIKEQLSESSLPLLDYAKNSPRFFSSVWNQWNLDVPIVLNVLLVIGFVISIVFHKRLSKYRIPMIISILVFIIPLLFIQRVFGYERTWLFLLPLYIIIASSGISYFLLIALAKNNIYKSVVFSLLSIIFTLYICFSEIKMSSNYYSTEQGTLRSAENVTFFLKKYLESGDQILCNSPGNFPLMYYFNLHRLPQAYFNMAPNSITRLLLVVNKSTNETLKKVLNDFNLSNIQSKFPIKEVKRFEDAILYEIRFKVDNSSK